METPSPHLSVTVNGAEREIFMSFGLLDTLCRLVGDPTNVAQIPIDFELREQVLRATLAKRKKSGKVEEECDLDDVDISMEDVERILEWVMEHTLTFFIRSLRKVSEVTQRNEKAIEALASSFPGLNPSISNAASSGQ